MKKNYLYFSLSILALLLSSCGGGGRSRTSRIITSDYSLPKGELTLNEFKDVVFNAVEVEKELMSKAKVSIPSQGQEMLMTVYKNGYYQASQDVSAFDYGYNEVNLYAYSNSDYSRNYYVYEEDGVLEDTIYEYNSSEYNDPYIMVYGYGQIGTNPAAFVACYSGLGMNDPGIIEPDDMRIGDDDHLYFTIRNYGNSEGMNLFFDVTLTSFGGFSKIEMYFDDNVMFQNNEKIYFYSLFNERNDPPQKLIDIFRQYN